jgi:hypothetical protein
MAGIVIIIEGNDKMKIIVRADIKLKYKYNNKIV